MIRGAVPGRARQTLALALAAAGLIAWQAVAAPPPGTQLAFLAAAVGLLGLPHGALDLPMAETLWPLRRPADAARFAAAYLGVAALVAGLWIVAPAVGLAAFLAYSVLHFSGDWEGEGRALRIAGGLSTIGAPALVATDAVADLFATLAPTAAAQILAQATAAAGALGLALAALAVARAPRRRARAGAEFAALWVAAAALPPLLYFVAYFCALHAPRHMAETLPHLADRGRAMRQMAGLLVLTLAGAGLAFAALRHFGATLDTATMRTVFVGLAALTVPHMLLVDRFRRDAA